MSGVLIYAGIGILCAIIAAACIAAVNNYFPEYRFNSNQAKFISAMVGAWWPVVIIFVIGVLVVMALNMLFGAYELIDKHFNQRSPVAIEDEVLNHE